MSSLLRIRLQCDKHGVNTAGTLDYRPVTAPRPVKQLGVLSGTHGNSANVLLGSLGSQVNRVESRI
jgi:hypothetical protein